MDVVLSMVHGCGTGILVTGTWTLYYQWYTDVVLVTGILVTGTWTLYYQWYTDVVLVRDVVLPTATPDQ